VGFEAAKMAGIILMMEPLFEITYKKPTGPVCKSLM
jgi:hypothetical protein